jgi:hypothetical protein
MPVVIGIFIELSSWFSLIALGTSLILGDSGLLVSLLTPLVVDSNAGVLAFILSVN